MAHFKTLKLSACEGATEQTDNTKKNRACESRGPGTQEWEASVESWAGKEEKDSEAFLPCSHLPRTKGPPPANSFDIDLPNSLLNVTALRCSLPSHTAWNSQITSQDQALLS